MEQTALDFTALTPEETAVRSLLREGRAGAVQARHLSERTGLSDRRVRRVITSLIMERGILVASATDDPPGFYIPVTADEVLEATAGLVHRGIMILARAARLRKSSLEIVFNQGRLELEQVHS